MYLSRRDRTVAAGDLEVARGISDRAGRPPSLQRVLLTAAFCLLRRALRPKSSAYNEYLNAEISRGELRVGDVVTQPGPGIALSAKSVFVCSPPCLRGEVMRLACRFLLLLGLIAAFTIVAACFFASPWAEHLVLGAVNATASTRRIPTDLSCAFPPCEFSANELYLKLSLSSAEVLRAQQFLQYNSSRDLILFLHPPKTGGTTISRLLHESFPSDQARLLFSCKLALLKYHGKKSMCSF
jgi:hypothetical protein